MSEPFVDWRIRIEPLDKDDPSTRRFKVTVDCGEDAKQIECELPPAYLDLINAEAAANSMRQWRLDPETYERARNQNLLFHAGDIDTLESIGKLLYDALFDADLTARLDDKLREGRVRIGLDIAPGSPLARVPWEAMRRPRGNILLATYARSPIVRLLEAEIEDDVIPATLPLRVLVVVANPRNDLDLDQEVEFITSRLGDDEKIRFQVEPIPAATREQFFRKIGDFKPHIVHFIGHGDFADERGLTQLQDPLVPGRGDWVKSKELTAFVQNDRPWLFVLNNCMGATASTVDPFGGTAQALIRLNIPFVVAMQYPISNEAATCFSQELYASIARDESITEAISRARNSIRTTATPECHPELVTPVLYVPSGSQHDRIAIAPFIPTLGAPIAEATAPPPPAATPPTAAPRVLPAPPESTSRRWRWALAGLLAAVGLAAGLWMADPWQGDGAGVDAMDRSASDGSGEFASDGGMAESSEPSASMMANGAAIGPIRGAAYGTAYRRRGVRAGAGAFREGAEAFPPPPATAAPPAGGGPSATVDPPAAGSGIGYASSGEAISFPFRRYPSLELFVGGVLATPARDRAGFSLGLDLRDSIGAWRVDASASADLFERGRQRTRLHGEVGARRVLGDGDVDFGARVVAARQGATGLRRRVVAEATLGTSVRAGELVVLLEAGPALRASRFAGAPGSTAAAASLRAEAILPLSYDLTIAARADALIGDTVSSHAGAEARLRLTDRLEAVASFDLDHEASRRARRDTAAVVRAGLRYRF